ncbi:MAG: hypothetical protein ABI878_06910 [Acidobacteriota bacterium]
MRTFLFTALFLLAFACGRHEGSELVTWSTPEIGSPPERQAPEVPIVPIKPLTRNQQKDLDSTLPLKVRQILEKAEYLEVQGLSSEDKVGIGWYPDVDVALPVGPRRAGLLKSFYFDASAGPNPSACFLPRHGLKATYNGKTVEVIICFQCHLFTVRGDLGEFDGGVYMGGSASHHLFEEILRDGRSLIAN